MPKLLLHICCGPCAIMPAIRLKEAGYDVLLWFMNPNIHPLSEYLRRREAAEQCARHLGLTIFYDDSAWNLRDWLQKQIDVSRSSKRCENCISQRLDAAARKADALGIEFFSTSLLYSRYQPHDYIATYGTGLSTKKRHFVYRDFRSDWQAGIDRSIEWNLYRQPYCGCIFSEEERYFKKLARLLK